MPVPLILASRSPRRRLLLSQAGYRFRCQEAAVDETALPDETPDALVRRLACAKARQVLERNPGSAVIGADTAVALDGRVYGKPKDLAEAAAILGRFSGRTQQVLTGLCVLHPRRPPFLRCIVSRVTFRRLSPGLIQRYLSLVDPLDKAGAYGIQCHGEMLVQSLEGSLDNVVGLPVECLPEWLRPESPEA